MNTVVESCPACGQKVRIPVDRGALRLTCPVCRHRWDWPLAFTVPQDPGPRQMANSELNLGRWRDVFQGLEIRDQPGHLIRPPDAEELGHFEGESGIRLPDGYRDFLLRFGTGLLLVDGREITISSPTCPRSGFYFTKHLPDSSGTADPSIPEIVPRLIHFASTQLGDRFAWDPENPSDLSAPEFAIYAMIYKENEPVRVADNFEGFLRFCLDPPTFDSVLHLPPVADEFDGLDDSIIHMRYYLREICESYVFLH